MFVDSFLLLYYITFNIRPCFYRVPLFDDAPISGVKQKLCIYIFINKWSLHELGPLVPFVLDLPWGKMGQTWTSTTPKTDLRISMFLSNLFHKLNVKIKFTVKSLQWRLVCPSARRGDLSSSITSTFPEDTFVSSRKQMSVFVRPGHE